MDEPSLIHDVPYPMFMRIMFFVFGAVPMILAPYELWRGIWPPNLFTPFFGIIVFFAVSLGMTMMRASLFGPSVVLEFRPGELSVREQTPWSKRTTVYDRDSILDITVTCIPSSDGPDDWGVEIILRNNPPLRSRTFGTKALAQRHAGEFRAALAMPD